MGGGQCRLPAQTEGELCVLLRPQTSLRGITGTLREISLMSKTLSIPAPGSGYRSNL